MENKTTVPVKAKTEFKVLMPNQQKPGFLGKDLAKRFVPKSVPTFRPTKPGGRNGQGKP